VPINWKKMKVKEIIPSPIPSVEPVTTAQEPYLLKFFPE